MGERALGWGLRLLGLALVIGPFIVALGMHNWDIQAAVLPGEAEINEIKGSLSGIFGGMPIENFTISNPTYDINTSLITANIGFRSNMNLSITITDISGYATCGEHQGIRLGSISMQEQSVVVPARGNASLTATGTITVDGALHIATVHGGNLPANIGIENASITLEFYGLSVRIQMEQAQGGP